MANDKAPRRRGTDYRYRKSCRVRRRFNALRDKVCSLPPEIYNRILGLVLDSDHLNLGDTTIVKYDEELDTPLGVQIFGSPFAIKYYSQTTFIFECKYPLFSWLRDLTEFERNSLKAARCVERNDSRWPFTWSTETLWPIHIRDEFMILEDWRPRDNDSYTPALEASLKQEEGIVLPAGVLKSAINVYETDDPGFCGDPGHPMNCETMCGWQKYGDDSEMDPVCFPRSTLEG